ncbi:MAG: murein biosynthesis integral membrane protein MurJ [Anaerolineae bacterium]
MERSQRHIARSALLVMGAIALSRVLGLVRNVAFSYFFGTRAEMDAYVVAARIPEMLFLVMAGGALGSAFIPLFTARLTQGDEEGAWRLASAVVNLLVVFMAPLSLLAIVLAPWLVRTWVAPEFSPALQARTVALLRIMLLSPTIFGVSGILMGVLNAYQRFLLPALAPSLYNLALIGGAIWGGLVGGGTMGPAVASVIGAVAHLLLQVIGLMRYQVRHRLELSLDDPGVRTVGMLMLPRMLGVAAVQINFVVTNNLASGMGTGAVSALTYAWALVLLPQGIFAQALGITAFPTLSAQAAQEDLRGLRRTVSRALRTLVALLIPATAGLMILGEPIVAFLLERGAFGAESTDSVAFALTLFALGLLGHGAIEILARAFYAVHNTWIPALAAIGAMVLNVILGLTLPPFFEQAGWEPFGGLALANSLAALLEMGVLLLLLAKRIGGLSRHSLVKGVLLPGLAALGMVVAVYLWLRISPENSLVQSLGGMAVGMSAYGLLAWLLGVEALRSALEGWRRRGA